MKHSDNKSLSIQISLNGLSFCIKNNTKNEIEYLNSVTFKKKETPFKILDNLESILEEESFVKNNFETVNLIHRNELSTLVPKDFFDEKFTADYLKFNAKILKTDYISYDSAFDNQCVNVYVPWMNINNYLVEKYGEIIYKHSSTVLLNSLRSINSEAHNTIVYINIARSIFELVVMEKNAVLFYNMFEISSPKDLCYYVLFTMEQLNLDVEKTPLRFVGGVDREDPNFEIIYRYIRDVDIIESKHNLKKTSEFDETDIRGNYLVLNSFN